MSIDFTSKKIWQQACGDKKQNYSSVCIRWGVILNGPGSMGKWPDCLGDVIEERSSKKGTELRRFCEVIKEGDIVLLRLGTDTIVGVGEVVGDYLWSETFGDIDGWDLEHVRRVNWLWADVDHPKVFPVYTLKFGDTTQPMGDAPEILEWLNSLEVTEEVRLKALPSLPLSWDFTTTKEEIGSYLYQQGVSGNSIHNLTNEFDELVRISNWYRHTSNYPSEPETIAYLVVPLLKALGWSQQKMAIEWNSIDIALFNSADRKAENLKVVVECKRMNFTCLTAFEQAEGYALRHSGCDRLIVTDGNRYGVFVKVEESFKLKAYLNLRRLRTSYPVYEAEGVNEAFRIMSPEFR